MSVRAIRLLLDALQVIADLLEPLGYADQFGRECRDLLVRGQFLGATGHGSHVPLPEMIVQPVSRGIFFLNNFPFPTSLSAITDSVAFAIPSGGGVASAGGSLMFRWTHSPSICLQSGPCSAAQGSDESLTVSSNR